MDVCTIILCSKPVRAPVLRLRILQPYVPLRRGENASVLRNNMCSTNIHLLFCLLP